MNALILNAVVILILFAGTWLLARRITNESIVDVTWSFAFAPVATLYALLGSGLPLRRMVIACLISAWSLRIGIYLWRRVASHHPQMDRRYEVLKERWTGDRAFLYFFLAQGLLVWLLMLPVWRICNNASPHLHGLEIAGGVLWAIALIGEAIADGQLKRFKEGNTNFDAVCRNGLWRYSRHPNYFFQSLLWWGLFLMALPTPWGWLTIIAPLAMLHFILNITGIPLTEELAVRKRGDVYRNYQKTTSALIPLPNKSTS